MSPVAAISRVLVGVDFDDASASALKMAAALASTWNAEITLFHSSRPDAPAYFTADQIEALEAEREQGRALTADELRVFAGQHVQPAVRVVVEEGPAADGIVRMAAGFDLIVVGTRRRHGARRWWLGSVAEAVVRRSSRPVLVVPAGAVVPDDTRRPVTILAAGGDVAARNAWVDVLRSTFGGHVVRSPDISQCAPDRLENTDLIVLSLPAESNTHFSAIVQVLKECVHPVLFVPFTNGTLERSPS
jgi:nucleotide-binding universal stress UspA family protein